MEHENVHLAVASSLRAKEKKKEIPLQNKVIKFVDDRLERKKES